MFTDIFPDAVKIGMVSSIELDVYKRQAENPEEIYSLFADSNYSADVYRSVYSFDTVSYTHLDVYKRQVYQGRARRIRPF